MSISSLRRRNEIASLLLSVLLLVTNFDIGSSAELPSFPNGSPWQEDISNAPLDSDSSAITNWLENNNVNGNGWGLGRLQTDDSLLVLKADCNTRRVPFTKKRETGIPKKKEQKAAAVIKKELLKYQERKRQKILIWEEKWRQKRLLSIHCQK